MKKTYLKPTSLTVKIEKHLMLSTSDNYASQKGEVLGREGRFSNWEEEEE